MITLKNIKKENTSLNINLALPHKGLFCIGGSNKEELLNIIAGIIKPTSGEFIVRKESLNHKLNYNDDKRLFNYKNMYVTYIANDILIKGDNKKIIKEIIFKNSRIIVINSNNISKEILEVLYKLSETKLIILSNDNSNVDNKFVTRVVNLDEKINDALNTPNYMKDINSNEYYVPISKNYKFFKKGLFWLFLFSTLTLILLIVIPTGPQRLLNGHNNLEVEYVRLTKMPLSNNPYDKSFTLITVEDLEITTSKNPQMQIFREYFVFSSLIFDVTRFIEVRNSANLNFIYGGYPTNYNEFFITKDKAEELLLSYESPINLSNLIEYINQELAKHRTLIRITGIIEESLPKDFLYFKSDFYEPLFLEYYESILQLPTPEVFGSTNILVLLHNDDNINLRFFRNYHIVNNQSIFAIDSEIVNNFFYENLTFGFLSLYPVNLDTVIFLIVLLILMLVSSLLGITATLKNNKEVEAHFKKIGHNHKEIRKLHVIRALKPYCTTIAISYIVGVILVMIMNLTLINNGLSNIYGLIDISIMSFVYSVLFFFVIFIVVYLLPTYMIIL